VAAAEKGPQRTIMNAMVERKEAMVITIMSRFLTWASSCARTPSSSS